MAIAIRTSGSTTTRSLSRVGIQSSPDAVVTLRRPQLEVVAPKRHTASAVVVGGALLFLVMVGALAFQTQVARNQLRLDRIDNDIRVAHEQYDALRRERAELRSPGRLKMVAESLGMVAAAQSEFGSISPEVIADVQRSGAAGGAPAANTVDRGFAAYAAVKAQAGGAP